MDSAHRSLLLSACTLSSVVHGFSSRRKIIANLPLVVEFSLFVKGGSLGIAPTLSELSGEIRRQYYEAGELCGALQHTIKSCSALQRTVNSCGVLQHTLNSDC